MFLGVLILSAVDMGKSEVTDINVIIRAAVDF